MQIVDTGQAMYCIVSYIAIPAVTKPPGELIYMLIGASGLWLSRNSSCAVTVEAIASVTGLSCNPPRQTNHVCETGQRRYERDAKTSAHH